MKHIVIAIAVAALAFGLSGSGALSAGTTAPAGLAAVALDHSSNLAWRLVSGATSYNVYRATSVTGTQTRIGTTNSATTTYTDSTAVNGGTYYYAVRAVVSGTESVNSQMVQVSPVARGCSNSNVIVAENCYPGDGGWGVVNDPEVSAGGVDVFATAQSINQGQSIDIKVNTAVGAAYHLEIWRSGYYDGTQGRLFSDIVGLKGVAQPACSSDATTGLIDCSNWSVAATITTTTSWPSGVYIVRAVRDNGTADSQTIFVLRNDSSSSNIVYQVPMNTYQAYNAWGGKSLYDYNSDGNDTIAGTPRAVQVSFDRPFQQPRTVGDERNYFGYVDLPLTSWLESQGYDLTYVSDSDLAAAPNPVLSHKVWIGGIHSEYWSAEMRSALTAARDAGVSLLFGSNAVYWKVRYLNDPVTGAANRVLVCYKSTQSGNPDPSGVPTGTWRDPAGANQPENALVGEMYVGDNDLEDFPLVVSATQGKDRAWRNTGLSSPPNGTSTTLGTIVGWEWDAPFANGVGPADLQTLSASPVSGNLIQNNGHNTISGSTTAYTTKYIAASGALVFDTGAMDWELGVGINENDVGTPDPRIQQAFVNVISDMGVSPTTPSSGIVVSATTPVAPTNLHTSTLAPTSVPLSWTAASGADAYYVYRTSSPRTNGLPLGTKLTTLPVLTNTFTDSTVSPQTTYYYVVTTLQGIAQSKASAELKVTTPPLPPLTVTGKLPAAGATGVSPQATVTATFSRAVNPSTVTTSSFTLSAGGANVPATVTYDSGTNSATLVPAQTLQLSTTYQVTLAGSITSADGISLGSAVTWTFTTASSTPPAPTVTSVSPAAGAPNVGTSTTVTAVFSRAMNASTFTASSFSLTAGGQAVGAALAYNATTNTATLTPSAALTAGTAYTATLSTSVAAQDGTPLAAPMTWKFTTGGCPCSLFNSTSAPVSTGNDVQDGRSGSGPFSYELGVKIAVSSPEYLTGIRFYKDPGERGAHVGRLWSQTGTPLAQISFTNETASGWQQASFTSPTLLQPGTSYVVSVNANATFGTTPQGLLTSITSGPLSSVADGQNGVFGSGAGIFPSQSWSQSNYFVDAVVSPTIPLMVTSTAPPTGATGISQQAVISATFSRSIDVSSLTSSSFTVTSSGGAVAGTVSYVSGSNQAVFTPSASLALGTKYTATLAGSIRTTDGSASLGSPVSWSFTTAASPPAPPTVTSRSPSSGASGVTLGTSVSATFSRSMDGNSLTSSSFTLTAAGGVSVAATVSYNDSTQTATLVPTSPLTLGTTYTATVTTSARAADGTPLASAASWQFTTMNCPCSLFSDVVVPANGGLPVQDGRSGTGPFSYELGIKITVSQPVYLTTLRFYKDPLETGTHIGSVWTAAGTQLAQTTFTNESASGWQQQLLSTPLQLQPGVTYVLSVNVNAYFGVTGAGLASSIISGPLASVADGANGVFGSAAGIFPTGSYNNSNYFIDGIVSPTLPLSVSSTAPADGATGVDAASSVSATFSRSIDVSSLTSSSFTVTSSGGAVAGTVSYVSGSNQAVFTPSASLALGTKYTATLAGSIRTTDGSASLGSPVSWSFTTAASPPAPPTVTSRSPSSGASGVTLGTSVSATFSRSMDGNSLTSSSFTLTAAGGVSVAATVSYNDSTQTATLVPTSPLTLGTTYTATVTTSARAADGTPLASAASWQFTTMNCPCSLFSDVVVPANGGLPVQDGRSGTGPFSYELGIKITVSQPVYLTTLRFYKDPLETGTHIGSVWTAAGTQLAQTTFTNESASGWQQQLLSTPLQLQPGVTYVLSVNVNAYFGVTGAGLASSIISGPLASVADGANGVFGSAAGIFPTGSYNNSNYFIDGIVQ